jgi:glycosyltransferase involved in cell wall biosynthesis
VVAQSYPNFELIVVDDASTDDVEEVVSRFDDSRIHLLSVTPHRGLAFCSNLAVRASQGQLITFLGDDDEFETTFLEETDRHHRASELIFSWCGIREHFSDGRPAEVVLNRLSQGDRHQRQMVAISIGTGFGFAAPRQHLLDNPFDQNLAAAIDLELFLRLVQQPGEWSCLPRILVKIHRQPQRLTLPNALRGRSLAYIIEKHWLFLQRHQGLRKILHFQAGTILAAAGERERARRLLTRYLRRSPGDGMIWTVFLSNELRGFWLGRLFLRSYRWLYGRCQEQFTKRS